MELRKERIARVTCPSGIVRGNGADDAANFRSPSLHFKLKLLPERRVWIGHQRAHGEPLDVPHLDVAAKERRVVVSVVELQRQDQAAGVGRRTVAESLFALEESRHLAHAPIAAEILGSQHRHEDAGMQ